MITSRLVLLEYLAAQFEMTCTPVCSRFVEILLAGTLLRVTLTRQRTYVLRASVMRPTCVCFDLVVSLVVNHA